MGMHAGMHAVQKRSRPSVTVVETGKKRGYGAPVQSADRHTRTKLFLHLSETSGGETGRREHHETELKLQQNCGCEDVSRPSKQSSGCCQKLHYSAC